MSRTTSRAISLLTVAVLTAVASCSSDDPSDGSATNGTITATTTTTAGGSDTPADGSTEDTSSQPTDPSTDSAVPSSTTTSTTIVADSGGGVSPTTTTEPPAETTTSTTTTTTTPPAAGECLTGVWRLRSQEFLDEIIAIAGTPELTDWTFVGGEYLVTLGADGTYRGERKAWQTRIATAQGAIITTISSDDAGTYTVDGNQLSIADSGGPADVTLQLDTGGGVQDLPIGGQQTVGTDAISGTGTYECTGDVLAVTLVDYPGTTGDFTVTFDRA
jgi:hypothetical protein